MDLYNFVVSNKELIKILYGILIVSICLIIVAKSHKLFRISSYRGIRYFRNAFLFYAVAFLFRYILGGFVYYDTSGILNGDLIRLVFEFFLLIGGFFLLYSLLWKKVERSEESFSSILNIRVLIFYVMTFIITILDYVWNTYYFMFFSQIFVFGFATAISYMNFYKNGKKRKFLKFYFLAMVLAFFAGLLNTLIASYLKWNKVVLFFIYLINLVIFLLFLYGIIWITKRSDE